MYIFKCNGNPSGQGETDDEGNRGELSYLAAPLYFRPALERRRLRATTPSDRSGDFRIFPANFRWVSSVGDNEKIVLHAYDCNQNVPAAEFDELSASAQS